MRMESKRRRFSVLVVGVALVLWLAGDGGPACLPRPRRRQASAAVTVPNGDHDGAIQVGSLRRVYHLHVPPGYDGTAATPLVLVFHGLLETSLEMVDLTGFNRLADQKGFLVVYPDSVGRHWNDGRGTSALAPRDVDDVGFVAALIEHLKHTLAIDPKRVYATGMSNGAMFTQRLACELSDQLAAIGPVSGTMAEPIAGQCVPQQRVSVVEVHGTKDPFVPWDGGSVRALGGKVLSVPNTMARWVQLDGCRGALSTMVDEPHREARDDAWVRRVSYSPCQEGLDVVLYAIEGGRHAWPTGPSRRNPTINATEVIWDFFESHPKL